MNEIRVINVKEAILSENTAQADGLRRRLRASGVVMMNLMASPGAGKTSLILETIRGIRDRIRVAVLEGDIEGTVDAERVSGTGIACVQIRTGGFCHLDAAMVGCAIDALDLARIDLVLVENVGNLVCPAEYDIGADVNVVVLSVPEGDDKPVKYPAIFRVADAVVINKIDYIPQEPFDVESVRRHVHVLNHGACVFLLSCRTGDGVDDWARFVAREVTVRRR
jgi:hydrogenase nickel incorporation protein HypB